MKIESLAKCFQEKLREIVVLKQTTDMNDQSALHKIRCDLEPHVYLFLEETYGPALREFWKTHTFPQKSRYAWMIVERRCHPNLWFVLRNIAWAGPNMALYIICSDENIDYLRSLLGDKAENVHLVPAFKGFANRDEGFKQMEKVMTHPDFYRHIDAEYILTFQTDCFFRKKIPDEIFVGDYYGSPWGWYLEKMGGGGITIRNVKRMVELCSKEPHPGNGYAEDSWICNLLEKYGNNPPPTSLRMTTFSENFPTIDPIGVHQFWTFIGNFNPNDDYQFKAHLENILKINV